MSTNVKSEMNTSRRIKRTPVSSAVQAATTALIISAALPTVASAQLEEIIVTASKRAENLQDVAVSVIALDAQTLNDVGITNFDDY
ncbi:MAG: hypothetical protein HOI35_01755, partial [Woeseia sp.]|nr:hypothetical protein [Woeseia sp.]